MNWPKCMSVERQSQRNAPLRLDQRSGRVEYVPKGTRHDRVKPGFLE